MDLLVNNASTLGPTPLPALADYPLDELEAVSGPTWSLRSPSCSGAPRCSPRTAPS